MAADHTICPGAKMLRQPQPEIFECPKCQGEVEIWTDEIRGTCGACGATMMRDGTMSCLDWCAMGRDCVGDEAYDTYMRNKAVTVKQKLLEELEAQDAGEGLLEEAREAAVRATAISKELGADHHVVVAACILKSLTDTKRIKKSLLRLGFGLPDVDQVCEIVSAVATSQSIDSPNYEAVRAALN